MAEMDEGRGEARTDTMTPLGERAEQAFSDMAMAQREGRGSRIILELALRQAIEDAERVAKNAARCMCPFTPGWGIEGWRPDLTLGQDGKHKPYCPFGIAQAIRRTLLESQLKGE